MEKILFIESGNQTGASTATRAIAKFVSGKYEEAFWVVDSRSGVKETIYDAINKNNPEYLFCSYSSLNPDVIEAGKELNKKVIIRSDYTLSDISDDELFRIKETYPLADQIITQSEYLRSEMLNMVQIASERVIVLITPRNKTSILAASTISGSPYNDRSCFRFVWVGRENPIKGLAIMLGAFSHVHRSNPYIELVVVGDIHSKSAVSGVKYVGYQSNPYPWIRYADCLVLTSRSEAQPNVISEAHILGTTVISTKCFVPASDMSWIYWVEVDAVQELVETMLKVISGNK